MAVSNATMCFSATPGRSLATTSVQCLDIQASIRRHEWATGAGSWGTLRISPLSVNSGVGPSRRGGGSAEIGIVNGRFLIEVAGTSWTRTSSQSTRWQASQNASSLARSASSSAIQNRASTSPSADTSFQRSPASPAPHRCGGIIRRWMTTSVSSPSSSSSSELIAGSPRSGHAGQTRLRRSFIAKTKPSSPLREDESDRSGDPLTRPGPRGSSHEGASRPLGVERPHGEHPGATQQVAAQQPLGRRGPGQGGRRSRPGRWRA